MRGPSRYAVVDGKVLSFNQHSKQLSVEVDARNTRRVHGNKIAQLFSWGKNDEYDIQLKQLVSTVNSPNNRHFGTWASVLYSGSVLCLGVLIKPLPHGLNNAFDTLDSTITHFYNILAGMHNTRAIAIPRL